MKKAVVPLLVGVGVIALFVFSVMKGVPVQERQRDCEKRCAPRMGVWRPDPNYPAAPQGKTVPMVCVCQ